MVIVSSLGDPVDDEIEAKVMFSRMFLYFKKYKAYKIQTWPKLVHCKFDHTRVANDLFLIAL